MPNTVEDSFSYQNSTGQSQVFFVEPWGADYTVLPGQQLRLQVSGEGAPSHFSLQHSSDGFQLVWEAGSSYPDVFMDGVPVECGHNREAKA